MRTRNRRAAALREVVSFWGIILVASLVLASLAFLAGKYWVGGLIARSDATQAAPTVSVRTPQQTGDGKTEDGAITEPPEKADVKLEQRAPNDGERSEIEQNSPQDGAALNAEEGTKSPDASTGTDTQALGGDAEGKYKVIAGSYRNEDNAQKQLDALAAKGYAGTSVPVKREGETFHRVIAGSYASLEEANRARDDLEAAGIQVTVSSR